MVPIGKVFRGDALARHSQFAEGIGQMREGITELRSIGTVFSLPSSAKNEVWAAAATPGGGVEPARDG